MAEQKSVIPITRPLLDQREAEAASAAILSGWVTQGPQVLAFEAEFARFAGSPYACAVANCTAALQIALRAVGVGLGDVVLTVSHSFIATANAIRACGAEPVFIDIAAGSFNIDAEKLRMSLEMDFEERDGGRYYKNIARIATGESPLASLVKFEPARIRSIGRAAAILCVHQIGIPCELPKISGLAAQFGLPLVEDAACAVGSEYFDASVSGWKKVGTADRSIVCFSFHARKLLTTGDGGMITTADAGLDRAFRLLRHHGMGISDLERHRAERPVIESYDITGFNYRLTDVQAAIGRVQLEKLSDQISERRRLADLYRGLLAAVPWVSCYNPRKDERLNWQSFPIVLGPEAPISRDDLLMRLLSHGVSGRPGIMNAHSEKPYQAQQWSLPESERMRARSLLLPLFQGLAEEDVERIVEVIATAAQHGT